MSTEKKIIFLFLSLIFLIITCIFTHIDDLTAEKSSTVETSIESNSPSIVSEITQKVKSLISPTEEEITQDNISQEELPLEENETTTANEIVSDEEKSENINSLKTSANEVVEKIEEIEESVEPLITTDTRYKRTGDEKKIEDLSKDAQLLQIKMSEYVKQNPIIFKRGSNKIKRSSNSTIKLVVEALREFPSMKIEVAGHTDAIGAAKLNKIISEQRAVSVKKRLIYFGLKANRIKSRGYGEDIPLVKNSKNGYSKINRRVEFNIIEE